MHFALPCPACEAERAFSALGRIKNYLRSTMTECGLYSCCLLNIHSTAADELNVERLTDVWIDSAAIHIFTSRQLCVLNFA